MDKSSDPSYVRAAYYNLLRAIMVHERSSQQSGPDPDLSGNLAARFRRPASVNGARKGHGVEDGEPWVNLVSDEHSVEEEVVEAIERQRIVIAVRGFVASLPPRMRQVVLLVHWRGRTQAQAARDLGVTNGAVSKALKCVCDRGRAELAGLQATLSAA